MATGCRARAFPPRFPDGYTSVNVQNLANSGRRFISDKILDHGQLLPTARASRAHILRSRTAEIAVYRSSPTAVRHPFSVDLKGSGMDGPHANTLSVLAGQFDCLLLFLDFMDNCGA